MENALPASQPAPNWTFKRGLDDGFIEALEVLAKQESWFADVLGDRELTIGIRNNYLNVYADGQSLFLARWSKQNESITVSTHPKYLVDPDLTKQVALEGTTFNVTSIEPMPTEYKPGKTLTRMKKAAKLYRGDEKIGVQRVVRSNKCVVDLEIAFSREAEQEEGNEEQNLGATLRKVDIACFERIEGGIHLRFWEAKNYANADLWTSGDTKPPVVKQVEEYKKLIRQHEKGIRKSYERVAQNLVRIAKMAGRYDALCPLIEGVSKEGFHVEPNVGVVVFGFSAADKKSDRHKLMRQKLEKNSGLAVAIKGDAKSLKLRSVTPPIVNRFEIQPSDITFGGIVNDRAPTNPATDLGTVKPTDTAPKEAD